MQRSAAIDGVSDAVFLRWTQCHPVLLVTLTVLAKGGCNLLFAIIVINGLDLD